MSRQTSSSLYHKLFPIIFVGFFIFVIVTSCDDYDYDPPTVDPNIELSFIDDVLPIFTTNCVSCHGGSVKPDLSSAKAYDSIFDGYISSDPQNSPESSKIYSKLLESGHSANASDLEKSIILQWIKQGALNNK